MSTNYPCLQLKKKCIALGAFILLGFGGLQAQEAILAAGGIALGNGGSASYSVGQVIYTTNTGLNGMVVQGVQRPYEIIVESEGGVDINLVLSVYPNPAIDFLTLQVEDFEGQNLQFQLFDMNGRLTASEGITGENTDIMVGHLASGVYTLKVTDINSPTEPKTFKIIKK